MQRKVYNPKSFNKNIVLIHIPVIGKDLTARFLVYGVPMIVGFFLFNFLLNYGDLMNESSSIMQRIDAWVSQILIGVGLPIGLYIVLFTKNKDDRFMKDVLVGKVTYGSNRTIFNEKVNNKESDDV